MSRNDSIILSVSYDTELLTLREAFLRTQGCEVRSVMSIEDAVVLTSTRHFDALIVAYSVPPEDRRRLVAAVKQRWPRLPVLAVVADPQEQDKFADASVAGSADRTLSCKHLEASSPKAMAYPRQMNRAVLTR